MELGDPMLGANCHELGIEYWYGTAILCAQVQTAATWSIEY